MFVPHGYLEFRCAAALVPDCDDDWDSDDPKGECRESRRWGKNPDALVRPIGQVVLTVRIEGDAERQCRTRPRPVVSTTMEHDIFMTSFRDRNFRMPSTDAFALQRSGLSEFLFAPVGTEANGMTLSVVSVLARLGNDPWLEAARLATLPKSEATERLARSIASLPTSIWTLPAATAIAVRLITLLPTQSGRSGQSPRASANGAKAGRYLSIAAVLVCVACAVALGAGVFTTFDAPRPDGSSVASFAVSPR